MLGYFNAYGVAAHNTSAEIFVHLGDYVRNHHVLFLVLSQTFVGRSMSPSGMGKSRTQWYYIHMAFTAISSARIGRQTLGRELATIADYRLRLNQYRTDVSLRAAHEKAPWITVW